MRPTFRQEDLINRSEKKIIFATAAFKGRVIGSQTLLGRNHNRTM